MREGGWCAWGRTLWRACRRIWVFPLFLILFGAAFAQTYHDHEVISTDTVWRAADSPHRILGYVELTGDATLTLEPGCIVEFEEGAYLGLSSVFVDTLAAVVAIGTSTDSIVFRGWNHAAWNGIVLNNYWPDRTQKRTSFFEYCVFEDNTGGAVALDNGVVRHSVFRNDSRGLYIEDMDSVVIQNNRFLGSGGLRALYMGYLHIADNEFVGLSHPGVDAEHCDTLFIANNLFQGITSDYGALRLYQNQVVRLTNSNVITGCSYPLALHPVAQLDTAYTEVPASGNTHNLIRILGPYTLATSEHLYNLGLPYRMDGLEGGSNTWYRYTYLAVDPGVEVQVASGYGLEVSTIAANGTATDTLRFTCADTQNAWLGLHLVHGSLSFAVVERADTDSVAGIFLDGTVYNPSVSVGNCVLRQNFYGMVLKRVENYSLTTGNLFDGNREAGLYLENCRQIHLENQSFQNHRSAYGAILLRNADTVLIRRGTGVWSNNTWPVTQDIFSQLDAGSEFPTAGNLYNAIQYSGIDDEADLHFLYAFNIPYCFTRIFGGPRVNGRMEIEPGTQVLFAPQVSLTVYQPDSGHGVYAEGTPTDSIYFAALKPDSGWNGIVISFADTLAASAFRYCSFSGASSSINGALTLNQSPRVPVEHCTFHDNHQGLELESSPGCSLTVENTFVHNEWAGLVVSESPGAYLANQRFLNHSDADLAGLYLYESPRVQVSGCFFEGNRYPVAMTFNSYLDSTSTLSLSSNQYDAILVIRSNSDSTYFYNLGLEYHLSARSGLPSIGGYLRVDPGVVVRVYPDLSFFNISGTIEAVGTPTDSIAFLPLEPDTFWCGLKFQSSGQGTFAYCRFEGVRALGFGGALYLYRTGRVSIGHSLFKNNSCGLYLYQVPRFANLTWTTFDANKYAGIWARDCDTVEIRFNTFRNHTADSAYGALYFADSRNILVEDNNISSNNRWFLAMTPGCLLNPATFVAPSLRNRIRVMDGSTDAPAHWPKLNQDYEVTGFTVRFSEPVTFDPGVRVYLDSLSTIIFSDTFHIVGTSTDSIAFIAADTSQGYGTIRAEAPGQFKFCLFAYNRNPYNPALLVDHPEVRVDSCTFRGNTYGLKINDLTAYALTSPNLFEHNACGLYLDQVPFADIRNQVFRQNGTLEGALAVHRSPEIRIAQCTFEQNEWPVAMDIGSYADRYSRVDLSNNTHPVIRILSSSTGNSVTWWPIGAEYFVEGPVSIVSGGALTVRSAIAAPEAPIVRLAKNASISVRGTLQVWGSLADSVKFLGATDTTEWGQISLFGFEYADIRYAVFEQASNSGALSASASATPLHVKFSLFRHNGVGLNLNNANARVDSCVFVENGKAIQVGGLYSDVDTPVIRKCDIYSNRVGIFSTSTQIAVKAMYNFWGDATGPYDPSTGPPDYNPAGQGDSVSDYVLYRPWLTEPEFGWILLPGDLDADGDVDAEDIQALAQYLYFHGDPPSPLARGDVNQDNLVDDRDLVALCRQVLQNRRRGSPPAAPSPPESNARVNH